MPRAEPGVAAAPSDAGVPALEVRNLVVRYRGVLAVKGIDLTVGYGETVGIIGPNGAGKSSTLQALLGAVRPAEGTVSLAGEALAGLSPERIVRRGLSLVPEGRHVFGALSVADNLRLGMVGRRPGGPRTAKQDMARVLEIFPMLHQFRDRPAGLLSGGQQQLLAIARALLAGPDVLLLDEPSLGLSPTAVDTVFTALAAVRDQGTSLLVVEQRAGYTIAFAERTYVLHDGAITLELTPDDAHDDALLERAYFGS